MKYFLSIILASAIIALPVPSKAANLDDLSTKPMAEGGYDGIINNAILFINYCDQDGTNCVQARAAAWGQVCDKFIADNSGTHKILDDDSIIDDGKIYYSWRCEMLGETSIPKSEQSGYSDRALYLRAHPKEISKYSFFTKLKEYFTGGKNE